MEALELQRKQNSPSAKLEEANRQAFAKAAKK